jgi:hypothetical protein
MDEAQDAILICNKVATKLGCVVAVRVVELAALEPAFDVHPHHARMPRAQARAFQSVGFVGNTVTVEQDGECTANFIHPLLEGGECSKRNDVDAGVEFCKFFLVCAQLCGMFAAGYSAEMAKENEQGISAFEDFAEGNSFAIDSRQGEVRSGGVRFKCHVFPCQGKLRFAQARR